MAERITLIIANKFEEKFEEQNRKISLLETEVKRPKEKCKQMKQNMDTQEQSTRSLNVPIFGVDPQQDEIVYTTVMHLFTTTLKCNIRIAI